MSNIDPNTTLFISDDFVFYTLEGEGRYIGYPSVFMRMAMCNLTCIGFKSETHQTVAIVMLAGLKRIK